jgi:hypothetical protein
MKMELRQSFYINEHLLLSKKARSIGKKTAKKL